MGGGKAKAVFTAAAWCLCVGVAWAGTMTDPGSTLLFFSGTDLWRNGGFLHGGLLWSPGGLDREGFTLKTMISGGSYRYVSGALGNAEVTGREATAQLMPGWRFKSGTTELKLFGGIDLQNHRLDPDDPSSGLRGGDFGLRAAFEFWSEPTPDSMVAADGMISTIATSYALHGAAGWRVAGRFYLGPELQAFASGSYRQQRLGVHLTGFKTWDFEWSAAAGLARDSDQRSGAYLRAGVLTRR